MTTNNQSGKLSNALTVRSATLPALGQQVDIEDLIRDSRAENTWRSYERACRGFEAWCRKAGHQPLPASSDTMQAYVTHLVNSGKAYATINAYLAAIASAHNAAGYNFDRAALKSVLKGTRRRIGRKQRQVDPLIAGDALPTRKDGSRIVLVADISEIIAAQSDKPRGLRNKVLLSLGFAAALRRSELVGIDWLKRGSGTAYVRPTDLGMQLVLERTKTGAGEAQVIEISREDMPTACKSIEAWAELAEIEPGEPLLREVNKGGEIGKARLTDRAVARVIKAEVYKRALDLGHSEERAAEFAKSCSGHSLRAGHVTSLAVAGVPEWEIRNRSRHKTAEMVARYVRAAEAWTGSSLKKIGF